GGSSARWLWLAAYGRGVVARPGTRRVSRWGCCRSRRPGGQRLRLGRVVRCWSSCAAGGCRLPRRSLGFVVVVALWFLLAEHRVASGALFPVDLCHGRVAVTVTAELGVSRDHTGDVHASGVVAGAADTEGVGF